MEQSYVSTLPPTSEISLLLHPSLIVASETGSKYLKHENLKGMSRRKTHFKPFLHLHESVHDIFFLFAADVLERSNWSGFSFQLSEF